MRKNQSKTTYDKSAGRGRKFSFLIAILIPLLALSLGLFLRQWLAERSAQAATSPQPNSTTTPASKDFLVARYKVVSGAEEATNQPAEPGSFTQRMNGIEVTASNLRSAGGRVLVDVCFDMPDNGDWTIWSALLKVVGKEYPYSGFTPIEVRDLPVDGQQRVVTFDDQGEMSQTSQPAVSGQKGLRCDALYFDVSVDPQLAGAAITVNALAAYPREGEECTPAYLERVQKALDGRASGIQVRCKIETYGTGGSSGLEIVNKPATLSMEQATAMLSDSEMFLDLHGIRGPWVFTFNPR